MRSSRESARVGSGGAGEPISHGDLGSHQGGDAAEVIVEDFEQVAGLSRGRRIAHPIVEDDQIRLRSVAAYSCSNFPSIVLIQAS